MANQNALAVLSHPLPSFMVYFVDLIKLFEIKHFEIKLFEIVLFETFLFLD